MHGAVPDSSQYTPDSLILVTQQSSDVNPATLARWLQPEPPHAPHMRGQQYPSLSTPEIPLLHIIRLLIGSNVIGVDCAGVLEDELEPR